MTREFPYTFDNWNKGKCGEVINLEPDELAGYQSTYVYQFNYLMDRGWKRLAKRWVSPYPPHQTYGHIHLAYGAQKYRDTIDESTD